MSGAAKVRLALPGKGALEATTQNFLAECGMKVNRSNPRQYLARIKSMPNVEVVFQRAADIPLLVQSGDATLGITGYDILAEHRGYGTERDDDDTIAEDLIVLERNLGYGACRLVVAVPETWIDVSNCADLWHLSGYYLAHKGRGLRIATKYPILTNHFLRKHNITHVKIFSPHGALEAAPLTDTADLIVDLVETGTTLRENRLKLIADGTVLDSQSCLMANARQLVEDTSALKVAETFLELIEARTQARERSLLTAQVRVESQEAIQRISDKLQEHLKTRSSNAELRITISEIATSASPEWYTISGVVRLGGTAFELLETVAFLRSIGAINISVTPLTYRFDEASSSVRSLHERLKRVTR